MNRWRSRLAELQSGGMEATATVQNVQNVQKRDRERGFEQIERFERRTASASAPASAWSDAEEERAAIVEHDGGAPRAWAEALARLDSAEPPGDVPARRWVQFIDDCGTFLAGGWSERAAAFGWGPLDLFGCDRERPFARIDRQGLLWLLDGNQVVDLHRDKAIIETTTGARQTYRRRPVEVGSVVLAWELSAVSR
jgi:hypothetical protein